MVTLPINNELYSVEVSNAVVLYRELQSVLKDDDLTEELKKIRCLLMDNFPDHFPAKHLKQGVALLDVLADFLPDLFVNPRGGNHE